MPQKKTQNIINHIGLVLDASSSMDRYTRKLIEVADNQIKYLATRSQEMNQETRISVWTFADHHNIQCVVWDMDVLRLPSIAEFYKPYGNTALVDAMLKSLSMAIIRSWSTFSPMVKRTTVLSGLQLLFLRRSVVWMTTGL